MRATDRATQRFRSRAVGAALALACVIVGAAPARAEDQRVRHDLASIADLSLEDLMKVRVTSVSKKETDLADSAAAISVISGDDVRRLGITSLPEALRLVPGLEVARINAHSWAISARGFTGQYSDKLLVLIDGRIIYESRFPGVYWDVQDLVLEDLDRIEVIRGPGATLWGANAVNGVINIITRRPAATQGTMVSLAAGSDDRPTTSARYGGTLGSNISYRAYGRFVNRGGLVAASDDRPTTDAWDATRGGLRAEWDGQGRDVVSFQTDFHHVDGLEHASRTLFAPPFSQRFTAEFESIGGHALGRWQRDLRGDSSLSLQSYYAASRYADVNGSARDRMVDVEFQHRFAPIARHDVVWGAGYRNRTTDFAAESRGIHWSSSRYRRSLGTAFVQDEIAIVPHRVAVTAGSKFEHHSDTGFNLQPSVRAAWTPRVRQTIWAAASRALRTPDLFESGARINLSAFPTGPQSPPMVVAMMGTPNLEPERLQAYEVGYRAEPASHVSVDVAVFYNEYRDLIDFVPGDTLFEPVPQPAHLVLPLRAGNAGHGVSRGIELSGQWRPFAAWRLAPNYTFLHIPFLRGSQEFDSPSHRAALVSYLALARRVELNAAAYYVGALETKRIPAYTRVDAGLTWRAQPGVELGIWGQNLTDSRHVEFESTVSPELAAVKRSIVARIVWKP